VDRGIAASGLRFGRRPRPIPRLILIGAIVVLVWMVLPAPALVGSTRASPAQGESTLAPIAGTAPINLSLGNPFPLSNVFWGSTVSVRANLIPSEANLISSTPARVLVWPGGGAGDTYDPLNATIHTSWGTPITPPSNESQFVSLCLEIRCTAIFQVPGEINSSSSAAAIVAYTESTLHFHPAYWEIGNEPSLWKHWGQPWARWNSTDYTLPPSPSAYAAEVHRYIAAMRAVDPTARFIGLPGIGTGGFEYQFWVKDTVEVNGPNLSGVAVHEYPAKANSTLLENLTLFYETLHASISIPARVTQIRNWIASAETGCATCNVSLFFTEIGSTLDHRLYAGYGAGFPGVLDMAAQMTQGLRLNVTNIDLYASVFDTVNSWFTLNGTERPLYGLYSSILSRLGSEVYPVDLSAPTRSLNNTTYAVATLAPSAGDRADLMVVNTNLSTSVTFVPRLPLGATASPTEVWSWVNNTTSAPTVSFHPSGAPPSYTLPPQSLVLFEAYPRPAAPLRFDETGVPGGERWFVEVNGTLSSSAASNLTLFLPRGNYPTLAPALTVTDRQRYEPYAPTSVAVGSAPAEYPIPFAHQWNVSILADPTSAGRVLPSPGWWNASTPLALTATPAPGFLFSHWFGFGAGSYNGTVNPVSIIPTGPLTERAIFVGGYPVTFIETGLVTPVAWSVALVGVTHSSKNSTIEFSSANGSYGYQVGSVSGYRAHPPAGSVNVTGTPVQVPIAFERLTPPGPRFLVTFVEMGLPAGTSWSILVRNDSNASTSGSLTFEETNGSYGYRVGLVPGYRTVAPSLGFVVGGAATLVTISFEKTVYLVVWNETGLWKGLSWEVLVNGIEHAANGSWVTAQLANGSYSCLVGVPAGWEPRPTQPQVTVAGADVVQAINFTRSVFAVTFFERGLPSHLMWGVRFADENLSPILEASEIAADTQAPNGTYTFDVESPLGYYPTPSHGLFTVHAGPSNLTITFLPNHPAPIPSIWFLGPRAILVATVVGLAAWGGFVLAGRSGRPPRKIETDR